MEGSQQVEEEEEDGKNGMLTAQEMEVTKYYKIWDE